MTSLSDMWTDTNDPASRLIAGGAGSRHPEVGQSRTIVLVASSGGHLAQLRLIADRMPTGASQRRIWVTYDHVSARSSLEGCEVVVGFGPSTRNIPNALRNARLARRLYAELAPDAVVSTGAGIAVPFLLLAARGGIHAHYVESATRTHSPSLTGRILERASSRVTLHAQYRQWSRRKWSHIENVFDDFEPCQALGHREKRPLRILVTVGSRADFPFPALIERVRQLVLPGDEVVWQVGSTPPPPEHDGHETTDFVPYDRMVELIRHVDVVISHAGVGIALTSLLAGQRPVMVPRRSARGEVVDDHQVSFGAELAKRRLALVREVTDLRREDLEEAAGTAARRRPCGLQDLVRSERGVTAEPELDGGSESHR